MNRTKALVTLTIGDRYLQLWKRTCELTGNAFHNHWILEYVILKYDGDVGAPNVFVHLAPSLCRQKIHSIFSSFKSQRDKPWFTADTFWAMLRLRGIESNGPGKYAEAFYCRKMLLII